MSINPALPVPGITNEQVTLSKDNLTVFYCGNEIPTDHFVKVTVPSLLAFYGKGSSGAFKLLTELDANGFSIRGYGQHATLWGEQVLANREAVEARRLEAAQHRERMEAIMATPKEIAQYRQEQDLRRSELVNKFGRKGAAFGAL